MVLGDGKGVAPREKNLLEQGKSNKLHPYIAWRRDLTPGHFTGRSELSVHVWAILALNEEETLQASGFTFVRTGSQTGPIIKRILLLIPTIQPDNSILKRYVLQWWVFREISDKSLIFYFQNDWSGYPVLRAPSEIEIRSHFPLVCTFKKELSLVTLSLCVSAIKIGKLCANGSKLASSSELKWLKTVLQIKVKGFLRWKVRLAFSASLQALHSNKLK